MKEDYSSTEINVGDVSLKVRRGQERWLSQEHLRMLTEESGISKDVVVDTGYETVRESRRLMDLGFAVQQARVPGLLVPLLGLDGRPVSYQYRPDNPRVREGKVVKYETPQGSINHLHIPKSVLDKVLDANERILITEGVKKADAAASRGYACIALIGVWNWRTRDGERGSVPIAELDDLPWRGREVYVVFDSDAASKEGVRSAEAALAEELRGRGADVRICRLAPGEAGKRGLDDFLVGGGEMESLLRDARVASATKKGRGAEEVLEDWMQEGKLVPFVDQHGRTWLWEKEPGHVVVQVPGKGYGIWLANWLKSVGLANRGSGAADHLANLLVWEGEGSGRRMQVETRVGFSADKVFLNLNNEEREVVEITGQGWTIIPAAECPVRFQQIRTLGELPRPEEGGDLAELADILGLSEDNWLMVRSFLVCCFLPEGELPLLVVRGCQGSGKSTLCRALEGLIDPKVNAGRHLWGNDRDLLPAVSNAYVLGFDNVDRLTAAQSDTFCRLSSGTGISQRRLYEDTEEVAMRVRRPVILNGIVDFALRPDLRDRMFLVEMSKPAKRKSCQAIEKELASRKPHVLGALCDAVSLALRRTSSMDFDKIRLVDASRFALASCPDSKTEERLANLLIQHADRNQAEVIEVSPFCMAVVEVFSGKSWKGTLKNLLDEVTAHYRGRIPGQWPGAPLSAKNELLRYQDALRANGIQVHDGGRSKYGRMISLDPTQSC